jgi:hypothetical protein
MSLHTHTYTAVLYCAYYQQGVLAYYYRHAHPELGLATDRCKYNYMWDTEECRRYVKLAVAVALLKHSFLTEVLTRN